MTNPHALWHTIEQTGSQIQPHEDEKQGFSWRIDWLRTWSDPEPTQERALAGALTWLIQQAKMLDTMDEVAEDADEPACRTYMGIVQKAERRHSLRSQG